MQVNKIYDKNDNPKLRTKNIINQFFLEIIIFERVYIVLTQLGFTLFHPLQTNYENNDFNPKVYTGLEKFKAYLSGKLNITSITDVSVEVNVHEMNKTSLDRVALLLQQKSNICAN
tara:strand:+ start:102 stop:449 length:348 start_codon:yes stop_codon:yes gene_type:complete